MTVETLTKAPPYTISGIGPYEIPHPYGSGAIHAYVLIDGVPEELSSDLFTVSPESSLIQGDLYLTAAAASDNDGLTLWIERVTLHEQGWAARTGAREAGMENQLDQGTLAAQEDRALLEATLRGRRAMEAFDPEAGHVPVVREDGLGWENGPSVDDILAVQAYAQAANESAVLSENWAEGIEPGGPDTKSAKAWAAEGQAILAQTMDVFDYFDDRYLGPFATDPATDNDGNALIAGTLYFNTTLPGMKVYTGAAWVAAYISGDSLGTAAARDAQTGPTDATLLRLLQVGAFGLGLTDAPAITDLTAAIPNGFFSFSEATVTGYPTAEAYNQMGFAVSSSNGTMVLTMRQSNNAAYAQPMLGVRLAVGAFVWMKLQTDAQVSSDPDLANEANKLPTRGAVAGAILATGLNASKMVSVLASKSVGTAYQNPNDYAILVAVRGYKNSGSFGAISVSDDNVIFTEILRLGNDNGSGVRGNATVLVGPLQYYVIESGTTVSNWSESV